MDSALETKVIECLEALEAGQAVDDILARYPAEANELRPILETALAISQVKVGYRLEAQALSKKVFMAEAERLRAGGRSLSQPPTFWRRLVTPLASLAGVAVILLFALVTVSAGTVPGDAFYGAKLAIEEARLSLSSDIEAQRQLRSQFANERLAEIQQLLDEGRSAEVIFSGIVEDVAAGQWQISGLGVDLDENTLVRGIPGLGAEAVVRGWTANGRLLAGSIDVFAGGRPLPTPEPDTPEPADPATELPDPTEAPSPTPTPPPSPTVTVTPTPSDTPTAAAPDEDEGSDLEVTDEPEEEETPPGTDEPDDDDGTPEATDEADDDDGTPEATDEADDDDGTPEATDEPDDDDGTPEATDEPDDDDYNSGSGSGGDDDDNSGSGSGSDDD